GHEEGLVRLVRLGLLLAQDEEGKGPAEAEHGGEGHHQRDGADAFVARQHDRPDHAGETRGARHHHRQPHRSGQRHGPPALSGRVGNYSQAMAYQRLPYQRVEYHRLPLKSVPYQRVEYHRLPAHWLPYQRLLFHWVPR